MAPREYSEDTLVEQPAIQLLEELGWESVNAFTEFDSGTSDLGRDNKGQVVLAERLRPALEKLNPKLPAEAINLAIEELSRDRSALDPVAANREVYELLKNGVKVTYQGDDEEELSDRVWVVDWKEPANNDYFLVSQFWITGEMYTRRTDLLGFVNGLPLVFIELKATHRALETAYKKNLKDYKDTIPQLFWYNALVILSNGSESRIGSVSAAWEHFTEWKRINSEGEQGVVSLETMLRGTCDHGRLLDLVENFTLFMEVKGGLIKLNAKNHQYLGVNNSMEALVDIKKSQGRLGVFWHTQGSGKSISMIFFAQKVLRKRPGNWTFVIVTDRRELDDQIYKNFARCGVVTEKQAQATSGEHLKQMLSEDHRYVFTLIQKFRTAQGEVYPKLTDRDDVIVITDEAHRSQYDTFALNMRNAMPNASFLGFTGTPLMVGEEKTKEVFGDYVSIYNFKQSVEDEATVPLYYENRIPELQLTNEELNEDILQVVEEADLDEGQERKLEREFGREYHLITREERLETVAKDMVQHFSNRGFRGKAMMICIDKATAVKMYDKAQKYWAEEVEQLKRDLAKTEDEGEQNALLDRLSWMQKAEMAVVVSQGQNEVEELKEKGVDIRPHRKRMVKEDLDEKFKDPDDPFQLVFVCAMWMTGFDVPSCSTIYLDKPMRNHSLMQTIARANRRFPEKRSGLIVDYVGVFRNLNKALAIYGAGSGGGTEEGDTPVKDKRELVALLQTAIDAAEGFCGKRNVDFGAIQKAEGFDRVKLLDDAVDAIIVNDETKREFQRLAGVVGRIYKSVMPDPVVNKLAPACKLLHVLVEKIRSLTPPADISEVMEEIESVLDESIATEGYIIQEVPEGKLMDLSKVDFDKLKEKFAPNPRKRIEIEKLRGMINSKLGKMVRLNRSRMDFHEKFQQMIDEYNSGSVNLEVFFEALIKFAEDLNAEEKRGVSEGLSEEELALFDILSKPSLEMTEKEQDEVKKVARDLLARLKEEKLVFDWRKKQQTRATVKLCIEETLDELPPVYTKDIYAKKCEAAYQHVYDNYYGSGNSIYAKAA